MSCSRCALFVAVVWCAMGSLAGESLIAQEQPPQAASGQPPVAPPTPAPPREEKDLGEQRIRHALSQPATLEFIETPLGDVVEYLKHAHQIPIEIDTRALDDVGITTDVPISRNLKGISLRTALRIVLRDLTFTYVIDDEVLVITTTQEAAKRPATRVYSVAHLLPANAASADDLATLIRTMTPRDSSDSVPATIATYGPLLIVRDTEDGHYEVEKLLSQIALGMIGAGQPRNPFGPDPFEGRQ